jgi:hypothetical protein
MTLSFDHVRHAPGCCRQLVTQPPCPVIDAGKVAAVGCGPWSAFYAAPD